RKDFQWMGLGASLVFVSSFICEAAYSVIGKPLLRRASPMKLLTVSLLAGLAGNLIIDGPATVAAACLLPAKAWVLLVLLALICTALGYGVWLMVIRESQVNVVALTVFSQSIFGVPIAVLWLHETFHTGQWLGCLVILTGLLIGLSRQIGSSAQNKKACADPAQA
ncbi:MAG TPA: DMT family transporter, partial [Verrucomicrobiae bacterium]|nr:DMT family transporter [Verrucomicrobiae bacterium]